MNNAIIEIGRHNQLEVVKHTSFGVYLGDGVEEVLLPKKWVPEGTKVGDTLKVFVYTDSEDRVIATTMKPNIEVGQFACLRVKDTIGAGAFLDWGIEKDLFVPRREQRQMMQVGEHYVVYAYLDEVTDRVAASTYVNKFLKGDHANLTGNQEVELLVCNEADIGYFAIIDSAYKGLIYRNEVFKPIRVGDQLKGYIKAVREDGKIDVALQKQGQGTENIEPNAQKVLDALKGHNGVLKLHDKSNPEEIYEVLQMSKRNFKNAVGYLYKSRLIRIGNQGIELI